jgi:hypothetical protein
MAGISETQRLRSKIISSVLVERNNHASKDASPFKRVYSLAGVAFHSSLCSEENNAALLLPSEGRHSYCGSCHQFIPASEHEMETCIPVFLQSGLDLTS